MSRNNSLLSDTSSHDSDGWPSEPRSACDSGSGSGSDSGTGPAVAVPTRRAIPRRGHVKSRFGCFNCKRRHVKCSEQRPECSSCRRMGLTCVYPFSPAPIRPAASGLTLEDLRFYHQFLTVAFPTVPIRGKQAWLQAAAMSYSYEYLAHALLGLGASHLSQNCNIDFTAQALQHRVTAIKLVNERLDHPPSCPAEADALYATIICLVTQSSLISESMGDYVTMVRGATLVRTTIMPDIDNSIFRTLSSKGHIEALGSVVRELPKDLELVGSFLSSVMKLEPICQKPCELAYLAALVRCVEAVRTSSLDAWKAFVHLFMLPSGLSNEEFVGFIDPENHVGHLLVIHMFLLDYVLGQCCIAPSDEPPCAGRKNVIISWTRNMGEALPRCYQRYIEWPLQYCEMLSGQDARYLLSP